MADVESNILEHTAEFRELIAGFDLTLPGKDQSLGRDLANLAARGIVERTVPDQKQADGSPLKPNEPKYAKRKRDKHGVTSVGVLTGQMLSQQSVLGQVTITPDEVTLAYGTGEKPTKFATHGTLKPDEPTDRQKADWFTDGGRSFYELDATIADQVQAEASEALDAYLGGL